MTNEKMSSRKIVLGIAVLIVLVVLAVIGLKLTGQPQEAAPSKPGQLTAAQPDSAVKPTSAQLSSGSWFTPHAATRKVTFSADNRFSFEEGNAEKTVRMGNYAISGSTVTLKFDEPGKASLVLGYSKDSGAQGAAYLQGEGEYFVQSEN
jgi:regulator of protease activity HflC (stomatin/prohibitin superfamily)